MKIDSYKFGKMVIKGDEYTEDIIVCDAWAYPNWRREEGHVLHFDDIKSQWECMQPDLIIIGTGKNGMLEVPEPVIETIRN